MRYCAHCQKPRDRKDNKTQKGQRLCSDCHAEYMRAWRAKQRDERVKQEAEAA